MRAIWITNQKAGYRFCVVIIALTQFSPIPRDSYQFIIVIIVNYSIIFRTSMKKNQAKSVHNSALSKKRPSIQFSPTLQKPVYIITKNLNGPHIIHLTELLDKNQIPYQMQQQTQTLGFKLNQRFFVIVDNKPGEVTLGPQFGSILMTVVGYPRIGKNKKNKYFQKPQEIINFYVLFKNNRDISERQKSLINKEYSDIILQKGESNSRIKSKITVRSISKYKGKFSEISQTMFQKKLYVIQDKDSEAYSKLCDQLTLLLNKESIQRVGSVDGARKKTLFISNKSNIYYLVNEKNQRDLVDVIFIGEVLVFNSQIAAHNLKSAFTSPKIYGITSQQKEVIKMLRKIGFSIKDQSQIGVPKLPENSKLCQGKLKINKQIINFQDKQLQNRQNIEKKELTVRQTSKIEGLQSAFSENLKQNGLNKSKISQASTNSRKIKRINKKNKQSSNISTSVIACQYFEAKKQNESQKLEKYEGNINREKTLKTQEKWNIIKQKKNLKFVRLPKEEAKIKRIKSISTFQPKKVQIQVESNATMTQSEYFKNYFKSVKPSKINPQSQILSQNSGLSHYLKQFKYINAVFYRQFVHNFNQVILLIRKKPSLLFSQSNSQTYQPFFNMTEFDRYAKRIKRKFKESGHNYEEFRFLVFLLQEQLIAFEKYCYDKNKSYEEEGYEMQSIMKARNDCSKFSTTKIPKLKIYLFIQSQSQVRQKVLNFGNIKLFQFSFPRVAQPSNFEESLHKIRQKLVKNNVLQNHDYYHS